MLIVLLICFAHVEMFHKLHSIKHDSRIMTSSYCGIITVVKTV